MGRMLEALKQGHSQRSIPAAPAIIPDAPVRSEEPVTVPAEELVEEEFPFIEVGGGPGKKMDGSAAVMATPVPHSKHPRSRVDDEESRMEDGGSGKVAPPSSIFNPRSSTLGPLVPTLSQPRPMTVAFEPWPTQVKPRPATEIISYHQPEHPVSKQYDSLLQTVAEGARVLLFAGAKGAGTTTVLLNLAFSGCMRFGKRLVVVESNLCRPALAERLGIPPSPGWKELLAGSVALEKALQTAAHPQLFALTGNATSDDIPCEALRWVVGWLRDRFDLVLIDGPNLEDGQKLAALSGVCDGLYLVLPQNTGAETTSIQGVARLGMRLRGLIHTQFENM